MKRRVLSLITALALCLSLCPVWVLAADEADDAANVRQEHILDADKTYTAPYEVSDFRMIDTNEHVLTGSNSSAIQVTETGDLLLKGEVMSKKGAGVEVLSGGVLRVTEPGTVITGTTYALDIESGATVYLSAGTYTGKSAAINVEGGDLSDFLEQGCACFDTDGSPILPANAATEKTLVIGQCVDHLGKTYTHTSGTPTHTWTCPYCGAEETEACTFTFGQNGTGTCDLCGNSLTIAVDEDDLTDLVYDGTVKPEDVTITVTLTDGSNQVLVKDTDYKVVYEPRADAGEITVTVTGITFNGTFTKIYYVEQDEPGIAWNADTKELDYDGRRATIQDELPSITITIRDPNGEDLHPYLQYSYRKVGDTDFTDGLPLDAGQYEIKAYIPESQNYEAAETDPCLVLTIKAIDPVTTAPVAALPTFNGAAQELVTAGAVDSRAVGAEIEFAQSENGPFSTTIPTATNAGDYEVWYKVEGTGNYNAVAPTKIDDVKILRKPITPFVTLSDYTYQYDGGYKQPKVTVKDVDNVTVLLDTEYQVVYKDNRDVGTATVEVSDKPLGNYAIETVEVPFQITFLTQEALSITGQRDTVTYGDKFVLGTSGGSGNGVITWKITSGSDVAKVDENSGQITIIGHGSATVQATKSGKDPATGVVNYEDATASWIFTADQKPVVATVTAEDKTYDGNAAATVQAVVEQGVLAGDEITITGLTGAFDDENAGADKIVTVNTSGASIGGTNSQHYDVSFSGTTVKATIHKAVVRITTAPNAANLIYSGTPQDLIDDSVLVVDTAGVLVEYALSEDGPYSTDFPEGTDAGTYTVWYRVQETNNYTGLAPDSVEVTIAQKQVAPAIALSGDGLQTDDTTIPPTQFYIYDGTEKEPVVTLYEADGTTVIPTGEYTVDYSDNVNAGTATVTVTAKAGGNYSFSPVTKDFLIQKERAKVLTAPEAAGEPLYYNTFAQKLVTAGTGSGGTMVYAAVSDETVPEDADYSETIPAEINADEYRVYYKVRGDANHSDSDVGHVDVTIAPKTVADPTIELFNADDTPFVSCTYDGNPQTPKAVVKDGSTTIGAGEYNVVYSDNTDAGRATVNITDKPGGNYTVTGSTTFVILKADIVFAQDPADAGPVYNGKAQELLIPGVTSGGAVMYALGSATSTYTDAIPTATEAGTYTVWYKVVGDKNHNDFAARSVFASIGRKPLTDPTIELDPISFVYDGTVKKPEVTVKDGETVLPKSEYTVTYSDDNPKNQGTYTITITGAAGGNYDLTVADEADRQATFTIGQTAQAELVIEDKPASTIYGDTFQLTTSGGSSASAVTWEATGPATVNQTTGDVAITGVGEVTITATNPGDQNYIPVQAKWTFTAAPKPVTATIVVDDKDYDGATDATVSSASISTLNGDTVTIDKTTITATFDTPGVGTGKTVTLDTSNVQVSGADAAKYDISYHDTVTAAITQATTTVTTPPAGITPLTYSGQPQALVTPGETNVGFLVYSLDGMNFSPAVPTGTDAKTYTVYYKVDGTADYKAVAVNTVPVTVTIAPKAITPKVELSKSSYVYDGSKKEPEVTVKDGNTVLDEDQYTVTWDKDLTSAGTHTATISQVSGKNYTFSDVTARVEITKATQPALDITGQPAHVYYGDTVTTLGTTGGSGNGTVTWSITEGRTNSSIDATTGVLTVKDTGSITVEAERTVPNYETVTDTWTFTVEPKPVTAVVTVTRKTYDGTTNVDDADIKAEVKPGDLVDSADSFTISGLTGAYADANAGTGKTVTLNKAGMTTMADSAKYTVICPDTATADITPRQVTVTVTLSDHDLQTDNSATPPKYYTYDGAEKKPAVTVTGVDGGYSATLAAGDYTVTYADNKNVGTATVTVAAKAGGNYTFTQAPVQFEIRKAAAVLTSSPQAKDLTYTGQMQELVTVGTAAGGHVEYALDGGAYSADIPKADQAGTYVVTYKAVGDGNYEDSMTVGSVSVTIKPKEVVSPVITVSGTYTYDGTSKEPSGDAVEVKDGSTTIPASEYNLYYTNNIDAGTATVHVINANSGNYIVNGTAAFTIEKADASVGTAPEGIENLPYNGTPQELVTAGSAAAGTMVYSLSQNGPYSPVIPTGTAVNTYTVWYKAQGDSNYNDSTPQAVTTPASIVVNNVAAPVVQVTPGSVKYNGEKQEPTVTVRDDKDGHLIDGSEYTVTYADENGNTDLTKVGTYTVTVKNTSGSNYLINNSTAVFKILPADQIPLTITNTRERVYYGDTIQLGTTGGNGAVTWSVDAGTPAIASINTAGLLTITGVGSVTVTATSSAPGYTDQTATWPIHVEKKPVTAVVTAAAKTYDGDTTATVTAALQQSDLVGSDNIKITLSGTFEDPNAGTDKKVNVDSTAPDFTNSTGNYGNYNITYPATATASILKADIDTTDAAQVTPPTLVAGPLTYTGEPQDLVKAGSSRVGSLEYSLDNSAYSARLTGTDAGSYDVWYRVKGDSNHNDTAGVQLGTVTIDPQNVTDPIIEFTPSGASYDGTVHKPAVAVKDNNGRVIPNSEYTVTYSDTDWKQASTAAVKHEVIVTDKTGGNYSFTQKTAEFTISAMGQSPLSIVNKPGKVQYGDTFTLSAVGGSGTGEIKWEVTTGSEFASIDQNGLVTVLKSGGPVTVTATKLADGNYGQASIPWTFNVEKKPVTAVVTARDKEYDTNDTAVLDITWQGLLNGDTINLESILAGAFDNANVGTNKTVKITANGNLPDDGKYAISYNTTTTASILPKAATVTAPTQISGLTYTGSAQNLVNPGSATNGTIHYSLDGVNYGPNIPTGTNAGSYTVWYKAVADANYKDSAADKIDVTIAPRTVSSPAIELSSTTFDYDGTAKKPDVVVKDGNNVIPDGEYTVRYSDNINAGTATVTILDAAGGNYTVNGTATFKIKAGAAVLTLAPEEKTLTYTGSAQSLVRGGTAMNGQVVYSLTGDEDDYSPTIPRKTNADTYEVWYKVKGSEGYADTTADSVITVIQPKPVTPVITLTLATDPMIYTGSPLKPTSVAVVVEGKPLNETDYTVTYSNNTNPGTATVTVQSASGINYQFHATATFEIAKSKAAFTVPPQGINKPYTGQPQELIEAGTGISQEGVVLYSRDAVTYSAVKPTETKVGTYTFFAKVQGDSTHEDSEVKTITATISKNTVNSPIVELSATSFTYTGSEQKPTVTVIDDSGNPIPAGEYTVTYRGDTINPGKYTLTITSREINYSFTSIEREITITGADQPELTITGKPVGGVCYGDTLYLGTTGGSGGGAVTWTATGAVTKVSDGQFKITNSGGVTITATKAADGGYKEASDTWTFYAQPKALAVTVIAGDKPYDGNNTANLTVIINSGLVSNDTVTVTATGHFTDANAGTGKTVLIDSLTIPSGLSDKYTVANPGTTTASITPKTASVTTAPVKVENLAYTGQPQALVSDAGCTVEGGALAYSLDGASYSFIVPTGTDAGSYTVWYKVVAGDENHKDSAPVKMDAVTIAANTDTPTVLCTPGTFQYDGTEKTPDVVVRDNANRIILEREYTVTFTPNRIAVDTYTVTVTDKPGGNYKFDTPVTGTFKIVEASQSPLSIVTDKPADVYYGDTFRLSAMGGSGSGAIQWSIEENNGAATIDANGVVKVTGTDGFTVTAYREGTNGYSDSEPASVPFYANPKPVTPVVTADDKPFDGKTDAALHASWKAGDLVGNDTITLTVAGQFATPDVGTGKQVKVTSGTPSGDTGNYMITWPDSTTASIYRVNAELETRPGKPDLTYTGAAQCLLTGGKMKGDGKIGTIVYSLSEKGEYSGTIPTGTNAGTYAVWYKVEDSVNYMGIPAASIEVTIQKATPTIGTAPTASGTAGQKLSSFPLTGGSANVGGVDVPGSFAWANGDTVAVAGAKYDVIFTPDDTANYTTATTQVTAVSSTRSASSTSSTQPQTTVRNGMASTVVSAAAGSRLVREAVANQSEAVVIQPEITGDVTKAEVSIPASTVSQLQSQTSAALTVSAPIADVTIPNAALDTLSRAGGTVKVTTEQVERSVVLTLTSGGESVERVPGGVTLTVPAEDAGPGTVAVLVHDDGTRETLQKSVVEDGKMNIPLEGSATVEIMDNSKDFDDVEPTSWAADAVAFASARELFNGTSETTFSPDAAMSRGMLATVLYNLEGHPDQDAAATFSDVSGDAWYADGVAWAAENGITSGYGDGQFGPDDSITREQFAVMLWKYAGSPETSGEALDFTDADQASGYALEALRWATANGILSGYGDGQLDPGGTATRAQAAQMLKNFMENT